MGPVAEFIALLGFDMEGEADLRRWQDGIKKAERGLDEFAKAAGVMAVAIGAAVSAAGAALGKNIIDVSAQFEGFETSLTTIEGSAEKAQDSLKWIAEFGATTPYEIAGVTDAFIRLKTMGIDPVAEGSLRTLGDAASAMNKPLMQAVEALTDATTFQFERLREFGITASQAGDQVTFSWQRNGETVTKTVKKQGDEVRKFVLENLGDRFNGAMIAQSKTWNGMISNLADSWTWFQYQVGEGGFFDAVKGQLSSLLDYIGALNEDGTLDRWSEALGKAFTQGTNAAAEAIRTLGEDAKFAWNYLKEMDPAWFNALGAAAFAMAWRVFPLSLALGGAALALESIIAYARGADETVFGDLVGWIEQATGAAQPLAEVLAGIAVSLGVITLAKPGAVLRAVVGALNGLSGIGAGAAGAAGGAAVGVPGTTSSSGARIAGPARLAFSTVTVGSLIARELFTNLSAEEMVDRARGNSEMLNEWANNSIFGDVSDALNWPDPIGWSGFNLSS